MPFIQDTTKTWLIGDLPIYNYQTDSDRNQRWHFKSTDVNLLFADIHVGSRLKVPPGTAHKTDQYDFWPMPDWERQRQGP
jgi:hypothetical protein